MKKKPIPVRICRDGREVCNQLTKEGRDIYEARKRIMWERQGRMCCLRGHIKSCPGKLNWADATFDHEIPRGHGGGSRDDRIEIVVRGKTRWLNGAAHARCNIDKGSRRIDYNAEHNEQHDWEMVLGRTTPSGKVLFRHLPCGYETPSPTKSHKCQEEA